MKQKETKVIEEDEITRQMVQLFKNKEPWAKLLFFTGGAIAGGYLVYKLFGKKKVKDGEAKNAIATSLGTEALLLLSTWLRNRMTSDEQEHGTTK